MHNNVLALRWECRERREEEKEPKVSQARQRCRFLVFLSNSKRPTLLAPLAALSGQTERRMSVRKVTEINKGETPPPTTWPKAGGIHARCYECCSFRSSVYLPLPTRRGAGRRRPEEQLGSSHSVTRGLAAMLRCCGGRAKRPQSSWTRVPPPLLPKVTAEVFKAAIVKSYFYFASIFGVQRSLLRYSQLFYISLRSLGNLTVWVVLLCELHSANERWRKRTRV